VRGVGVTGESVKCVEWEKEARAGRKPAELRAAGMDKLVDSEEDEEVSCV
jgi:hypothetical protein